MSLSPVMFKSGKDDWETPPDLFAALDAEFHFKWDAAATRDNSKVPGKCFHPRYSAFDSLWTSNASPYWLNPPYSRGLQALFIAKARRDSLRYGSTVVCLLPARTDTKMFHEHIWDAETHQPREGVEVRFLKGRLRFVGAKDAAPFPSMIVIFRGQS
jgi:phage N-6-adenine-methyltransferase